MLTSLHVENIAVIKSIDLDFPESFVALTGETGAGKTVIIDSINLLLGAKADKDLIRFNSDYAMVSGCFDNLSEITVAALKEAGISPDEEGKMLIQRTVGSDGRSSIKINGRTVTLSLLKSIAPSLISIHGQSDTAVLMDASSHIALLDVYASNDQLNEQYAKEYQVLETLRHKIKDIREKEHERERLREMLAYQIKDIDSAGLHSGEEEELVDKKVKIRNGEKIFKHADFVYRALRGAEKVNAAALMDKAANSLEQLSLYIPKCADYVDKLRECAYHVTDIAEEVYAYTEDIDASEGALNEIESRLDKISKLKRKYGLTVDDILEFRRKAAEELETIENFEQILKKLTEEENAAYAAALSTAEKIHEQRVEYAKQLETKVKETLEFLDMPKVVFYASIKEKFDGERKQLTANGSDTVEFYISANRGSAPQPLNKIASGGELARIMLALKSTITSKDGTSTIIFDEIDAGVSGKTARKIGIKMLELSKSVQLLCITHSAQIASLADEHLFISKRDVNGATESSVKSLDRDGRITELSRILGGIDVTDAQRAAAIDMLDERKQYI